MDLTPSLTHTLIYISYLLLSSKKLRINIYTSLQTLTTTLQYFPTLLPLN
jgi:hypothetical protein